MGGVGLVGSSLASLGYLLGVKREERERGGKGMTDETISYLNVKKNFRTI